VIGPSLNSLTLNGTCPALRRVEFKSPFSPASPANLFLNCFSLIEIVGDLVLNGTNWSSMFSGCTLLTKFPNLTTTATSGVNATNMFYTCYSMVEPPHFDTSGIANWSTCFAFCYSLVRLWPEFVIGASATVMGSMFINCQLLQEVPTLDVTNVTNMTAAFSGCASLRRVSLVNTSKVANVSNMFINCAVLEELKGLDLSGVSSATNMGGFVSGCNRLYRIAFLAGKGPAWSWTVVGMIDAAGLDAIYTALPTITGQTITVTNVPGTLGDNPAIATAKGWTVTGS
jgi:hypothetical protein